MATPAQIVPAWRQRAAQALRPVLPAPPAPVAPASVTPAPEPAKGRRKPGKAQSVLDALAAGVQP